MSASANSRLSAKLLAVLYLEFALTGTVTTLLGPLMPHVMKRCAMSDANAGLLLRRSLPAALLAPSLLTATFASV